MKNVGIGCFWKEIFLKGWAAPIAIICDTFSTGGSRSKRIHLFFEFFSTAHGDRRKLCYGSNTLIWCTRDAAGDKPKAMKNPKALHEQLQSMNSQSLV